MPLDDATTWGKDTADAVKAIGVDASADVTDAQLELVWAAIKGVSIAQLGKAAVAPGSFASTVAVTGIGGPVT